MDGFEDEEADRPEFKGESIKSPVDGSEIYYFPPNEYILRLTVSYTVVFTAILIIVSGVGGIFIFKYLSTTNPLKSQLTILDIELGSFLASLGNAFWIQIMNIVYGKIGVMLNDHENHKTETDYEDNLIAKTFLFQFVNSYAALFYICFVKEYIGDECPESCMTEASTALATIFITRLLIGNLTEVGVPAIKQLVERRGRAAEKEDMLKKEGKSRASAPTIFDLTPIEEQLTQEEYHQLFGIFEDYLEMVIQYGYATMFAAAFPLGFNLTYNQKFNHIIFFVSFVAPLMALVNNDVEIRVDGWKLCQLSRRPEPNGVEDIGKTYNITFSSFNKVFLIILLLSF